MQLGINISHNATAQLIHKNIVSHLYFQKCAKPSYFTRSEQKKDKERLLNPEHIEVGKQFVVGWGTLMLINAVLAQGKNRSGLVWFFISLFLGPVTTLILALVPKLPENQ
ncbi:hypothetical protein [Aeromonas hydrophila]|uniref:hypothetical protein n=1 Tax=Aeromonas hydrophila TaxID=644 RepID=UPI00259FBE07|nr:hypothetical protein [Aeromonas hydrophila]MDM5118595.1 hypothetical protein [Aeromonas hydrophila]